MKGYYKRALEFMKVKNLEVKSTNDTLWIEFSTTNHFLSNLLSLSKPIIASDYIDPILSNDVAILDSADDIEDSIYDANKLAIIP